MTGISGKKHKLISRRHLRKYSWLPDVFRIKNSIIYRISGPVLTLTLIAVGVAYAWSQGKSLNLTNSITPLLGVVVGLILVFRNGTSYDRYYEGRKSFGNLTSKVRNLSRLIWVNTALPPPDDAIAPSALQGKAPKHTMTAAQLRRVKADALKLCVSFVFAVKHYLREEDGLHWEDYDGVVPRSFFRAHDAVSRTRKNSTATAYTYSAISDAMQTASPRGQTPELAGSGAVTPDKAQGATVHVSDVDVESAVASPSRGATKRVRVKRSKDKLQGVKTPLLREHRNNNFNPYTEATIPLPLVIAHELNLTLFKLRRDGFLETVGPAGMNAMNLLIQSMVDQMTNLERIANTPIPKSYGIHLKQCVSLYLFCLPFTLVKELGWFMVPVITAIAFTFMGIEGIADEIEMPFGYDDSDLPLDRYCQDLKEEIDYIIDRLPEGGFGRFDYDDGEGDD